MAHKKPVVVKLNPEKEIGYKVTDVGSGKVLKEGSTKVKDLDKKRHGGEGKAKFKDKLAKQRSEKNMRRAVILKNLKDKTKDTFENMPYYPSEDKGEFENMPYYPSEDKAIYEPMKKGGSVVARGNRLARSKPTKIC